MSSTFPGVTAAASSTVLFTRALEIVTRPLDRALDHRLQHSHHAKSQMFHCGFYGKPGEVGSLIDTHGGGLLGAVVMLAGAAAVRLAHLSPAIGVMAIVAGGALVLGEKVLHARCREIARRNIWANTQGLIDEVQEDKAVRTLSHAHALGLEAGKAFTAMGAAARKLVNELCPPAVGKDRPVLAPQKLALLPDLAAQSAQPCTALVTHYQRYRDLMTLAQKAGLVEPATLRDYDLIAAPIAETVRRVSPARDTLALA